MKKAKLIFCKYGISVLMIFLEVGGIIAFFSFLAHYAFVLWPAAYLTSFVAYLAIVNKDTNPENKIPWISIVLLFPPFGALIYAMFSERKLSRKEIQHMKRISESIEQLPRNQAALT